MGSSQSSAKTQSTTSEAAATLCCCGGVMDGLCCGDDTTPKTTQITPASAAVVDATQQEKSRALFRNLKKRNSNDGDDDATVTSVRSITSLFRRRRKNKSAAAEGNDSVLGAKLATLKKRDTKSLFEDDDDAIATDAKKNKRSLKSKLAFKKKCTDDNDLFDIETKGSETRSVKFRHKLAAPAVALVALTKRGNQHEAENDQEVETKKCESEPNALSPTDPAMPDSDGNQQARQEDHVVEEQEKKKKRSLVAPKFVAALRRGKRTEKAAGENKSRAADGFNSLSSDNVVNTEMRESKADDLTPETCAKGDNPPTNGWMCCNFNLTVVAPVWKDANKTVSI